MTYLDLEFPGEPLARAAIAELQNLDVTGEWHLTPSGVGETWHLSLSSEKNLTLDEITRLGGTLQDGTEGASDAAAVPAPPTTEEQGPLPTPDPLTP